MAKEIGTCVIKGKTIDLHLESEQGRSLLRWVADQPLVDDPEKPWFMPWAMKRNKYINEKLEMHKDDPELTEKDIAPEKKTALEALANQVINHENRIKQLETIILEEPKPPKNLYPEEEW